MNRNPSVLLFSLCIDGFVKYKAFFGWAVAEFKIKNPMEGIPGPRYKEAPVAAFTQEDLTTFLKACT